MFIIERNLFYSYNEIFEELSGMVFVQTLKHNLKRGNGKQITYSKFLESLEPVLFILILSNRLVDRANVTANR